MCFKHHLEPPEQAKMFTVYSYFKKEKESSESPLTVGVHSHGRTVKKRSGG